MPVKQQTKPNITPDNVGDLITQVLNQFLARIVPDMNYTDLAKIKTNTFKAGLGYVFNILFKNPNYRYITDKKSIIAYDDIELLTNICDAYIMLCDYYNKQLGLFGFSVLTGLEIERIRSWGENATTAHYSLYNALRQHMRDSSEECLKDSDIGRIAVANNSTEAGLNYGYMAAAQQHAATAPRLEDIARRYGKPPQLDG